MRAALALLVAAGACASPRPVLYPDAHLKSVGPEAAKKDVDACRAEAKTWVKANWKKPVAEHTGWGAATGALMGVVTGLITGDVGKAAASGAAIGGVAGAAGGAHAASGPDAVERAYVDRCLNERGYAVLGWR